MRYIPSNHTSISDRWQMTIKYLARFRKRHPRKWVVALLSPKSWRYLLPQQPLDGLTMYRQAVSKLILPPQLNRPGGKVILLISRVN